MTDEQRIAEAERRVDLARERLVDTVQALAEQLEPRRLARELWQDAKVKGADLAEEAVDAVKARPIAATGVAAAVAMFLAREPLAGLAKKWWGSDKPAKAKPRKAPAKPKVEKTDSPKSTKSNRTKAKPAADPKPPEPTETTE